jgi:hypothetical protein
LMSRYVFAVIACDRCDLKPLHTDDEQLPLDIDDSAITEDQAQTVRTINAGQTPTTMTGAIHIVKLRRIWSVISSSIYPATPQAMSPMSRDCANMSFRAPQLRQCLEEWKTNIPCQAQNSSSASLSVFTSHDWFQLAYHHSIILLYRHYLSCGFQGRVADSCSRQDIDRAYQDCFASAREMCLLYRHTYQRSSVRYTWGSLHILFLGALTYLHCLWTSAHVRRIAPPLDVINTCTACNMVLVIIAERWDIAAPYRDLFSRLSEGTIRMICGTLQRPLGVPIESTLSTDSRIRNVYSDPIQAPRQYQGYSDAEVQQAAPSATAAWAPPAGVAGAYSSSAPEAPMPHHEDPTLAQLPIFDMSEVDDWITGLEDINVPDESEWLVQDMIRGFGVQQDRHL